MQNNMNKSEAAKKLEQKSTEKLSDPSLQR